VVQAGGKKNAGFIRELLPKMITNRENVRNWGLRGGRDQSYLTIGGGNVNVTGMSLAVPFMTGNQGLKTQKVEKERVQ